MNRFPKVELPVFQEGTWSTVDTAALTKGKRVIFFGLPGAFTPTCSSAHVPRYEELYENFRAAGIDAIYCVSVNDSFVMDAWKAVQGADRVQFLPDGNGTLTKALDMWVDKADLGFGGRSWRYAMVVKDGEIEKVFEEPRVEGDPYEVSDADSVLSYLTEESPKSVVVIGREGCAHCARAKAFLNERGVPFSEVSATPRLLRGLSGQKTTPQIFIDGRHIGGADELLALGL